METTNTLNFTTSTKNSCLFIILWYFVNKVFFKFWSMERIRLALETLHFESQSLAIGTYITDVKEKPTALEFASTYYAQNKPIVIRSAISNWPALGKWSPEYFEELMPIKSVHVAITPNGYADGIAKSSCGTEYFVLPYETEMTMKDFLRALRETPENEVHYIQYQNSNLTEEFAELMDDIDTNELEFAKSCFNKAPDAINFWMGDGRAVSSMHKDPYENLYCVIRGYKDFVLLPPHQLPFIPRKNYPIGIYEKNEQGKFEIKATGNTADQNWVAIDPVHPDLELYPQYANATPIHVRVHAGDLLYIPNYWYHHVRQSHGCIAVNFWYDMEYDSRYAYNRMLDVLTANEKD